MASRELLETVLHVVASSLNLEPAGLRASRSPAYVEARSMAFLLARDFAQCSVKEFAEALDRDCSGFRSSVKKLERRMAREKHLAMRFEELKQRLEEKRT